MKGKDWFDEHMEVIGENPRQSKMLKNKIKEGLTEEFEKDWREEVVVTKKEQLLERYDELWEEISAVCGGDLLNDFEDIVRELERGQSE